MAKDAQINVRIPYELKKSLRFFKIKVTDVVRRALEREVRCESSFHQWLEHERKKNKKVYKRK